MRQRNSTRVEALVSEPGERQLLFSYSSMQSIGAKRLLVHQVWPESFSSVVRKDCKLTHIRFVAAARVRVSGEPSKPPFSRSGSSP